MGEHDAKLGLLQHRLRNPCRAKNLTLVLLCSLRRDEQATNAQRAELARDLSTGDNIDRKPIDQSDVAREERPPVHAVGQIVAAELEDRCVLKEEVARLGEE